MQEIIFYGKNSRKTAGKSFLEKLKETCRKNFLLEKLKENCRQEFATGKSSRKTPALKEV